MLGNSQALKFSRMQLDAQIYLGARVESLFGCLRYYNTGGIKFDASALPIFGGCHSMLFLHLISAIVLDQLSQVPKAGMSVTPGNYDFLGDITAVRNTLSSLYQYCLTYFPAPPLSLQYTCRGPPKSPLSSPHRRCNELQKRGCNIQPRYRILGFDDE